jgi:hypothetical protein
MVATQPSPNIKCTSLLVKLKPGVDISGFITKMVLAIPDAISVKALLRAKVVDEHPTNISYA